MTATEIHQQIEQLGPWFYEFDLGAHGRTKSSLPPEVLPIHQTRLEMVSRAVDAHFGARLPETRAIDAGCHEGYYAVAMARKGLKHVHGFDVREANLRKARFVGAALGLTNVSWSQANCEDLRVEDTGEFDLTLFLGILYHLENPMLCLRNISRLTSELCVIETQVVDEVEGSAEWGAREWTRPYHGVLALIDESGEFYNENTETGASPLATCPSPNALHFMLKQAGFRRTEIIEPPPGGYEQHQRGKRVVCAAYK
jgi:ubiquinone/menaquinone biosynthesis C-methylase UbiE